MPCPREPGPICRLRRFEPQRKRQETRIATKTKNKKRPALGHLTGPILHKRSPFWSSSISNCFGCFGTQELVLPASLVTSRGTARRTGGRGAQPPLMRAGDAVRLNSHRATTQDSRGIGPGCCLLHHRPEVSFFPEFQTPFFFSGLKKAKCVRIIIIIIII